MDHYLCYVCFISIYLIEVPSMIEHHSQKTICSGCHSVIRPTYRHKFSKCLQDWMSMVQSIIGILNNHDIKRKGVSQTLVPKLTASSSLPLSKEVLDDSNSVRPSADEQATCCRRKQLI